MLTVAGFESKTSIDSKKIALPNELTDEKYYFKHHI